MRLHTHTHTKHSSVPRPNHQRAGGVVIFSLTQRSRSAPQRDVPPRPRPRQRRLHRTSHTHEFLHIQRARERARHTASTRAIARAIPPPRPRASRAFESQSFLPRRDATRRTAHVPEVSLGHVANLVFATGGGRLDDAHRRAHGGRMGFVRCGMTSSRAFSPLRAHGIIARCAPREPRRRPRKGRISRIYYVVSTSVAHRGCAARARGDRRRIGDASRLRIRRWRRDKWDLAGIFNTER